jgi:hypothetical protein
MYPSSETPMEEITLRFLRGDGFNITPPDSSRLRRTGT